MFFVLILLSFILFCESNRKIVNKAMFVFPLLVGAQINKFSSVFNAVDKTFVWTSLNDLLMNSYWFSLFFIWNALCIHSGRFFIGKLLDVFFFVCGGIEISWKFGKICLNVPSGKMIFLLLLKWPEFSNTKSFKFNVSNEKLEIFSVFFMFFFCFFMFFFGFWRILKSSLSIFSTLFKISWISFEFWDLFNFVLK